MTQPRLKNKWHKAYPIFLFLFLCSFAGASAPDSFVTIGLMSGTSMDGIDATLMVTDGKTQNKEIASASIKYEPDFHLALKGSEYAVRKYAGDLETLNGVDFAALIEEFLTHELTLATDDAQAKVKDIGHTVKGQHTRVFSLSDVIQTSTLLHGNIVLTILKQAGCEAAQVDLVGYHGQTLFHAPKVKSLQVGDGQFLADLVGIAVITDFRSRDVAAGGQGAPFAPLYHQALAVRDKLYPCAVVNNGGIGNITYIMGPEHKDLIGFDTGPGNRLVDLLVKKRTGAKEEMDADGKYGSQGRVHEDVMHVLYEKSVVNKGRDFFELAPPKSLDSGDLVLIPELDELSVPDACATLEAFTADSIVRSLTFVNSMAPLQWILGGGGWKNPVIKRDLKARLIKRLGDKVKIQTVDEMGWNNASLEAQIFAFLAVRSLLALPLSVPETTGVLQQLTGGHAYIPRKGSTAKVKELLTVNPSVLTGYNE
jgi:anhydro-N-acetylmuramic acid kinase